MDADEVVLVVCACGRRGSVIDRTAWWIVDLSIWVRRLCAVRSEFCYGVTRNVAGVGVVALCNP